MASDNVRVLPLMSPPTIRVAPYSPRARAQPMVSPAAMPRRASGSVTERHPPIGQSHGPRGLLDQGVDPFDGGARGAHAERKRGDGRAMMQPATL
jgi:hypothetical protein